MDFEWVDRMAATISVDIVLGLCEKWCATKKTGLSDQLHFEIMQFARMDYKLPEI